jgi:hypothetical protein
MAGFELGEKSSRGSPSFLVRVVQSLPNALAGIRACSQVEQLLICGGILHGRCRSPFSGQHHRPLTPFETLQKPARTAPEGRQRLAILSDVNPCPVLLRAPFQVRPTVSRPHTHPALFIYSLRLSSSIPESPPAFPSAASPNPDRWGRNIAGLSSCPASTASP